VRVREEDRSRHAQQVRHVGADDGVVDVADHGEACARRRHEHRRRRARARRAPARLAEQLERRLVPGDVGGDRPIEGDARIDVTLGVARDVDRNVSDGDAHERAGHLVALHPLHGVNEIAPGGVGAGGLGDRFLLDDARENADLARRTVAAVRHDLHTIRWLADARHELGDGARARVQLPADSADGRPPPFHHALLVARPVRCAASVAERKWRAARRAGRRLRETTLREIIAGPATVPPPLP
jgi:hypothetical protein